MDFLFKLLAGFVYSTLSLHHRLFIYKNKCHIYTEYPASQPENLLTKSVNGTWSTISAWQQESCFVHYGARILYYDDMFMILTDIHWMNSNPDPGLLVSESKFRPRFWCPKTKKLQLTKINNFLLIKNNRSISIIRMKDLKTPGEASRPLKRTSN